MNLKNVLIGIGAVLLIFLLAYCNSGKFKRTKAEYLGYSITCVDGVNYIQFATGATVKMNENGTVSTCR